MKNRKAIQVRLARSSYPIYIQPGCFKQLPAFIGKFKLGNFGIVLTSHTVTRLYRKHFKKIFPKARYRIITIIDGEKAKSQKFLFYVINKIVASDALHKKLFIVCLGGGTVGDLGGFIASIYKRGIPYIQVPTTLLSQIDSSIGGKTGVDLPAAKNILGAIYQPRGVIIDPNFLSTLSEAEFRQGMAEAIKYGVIKDPGLFAFLQKNYVKIIKRSPGYLSHLIATCAGIKARIVSADAFETKGVRTILNFGHTFAHALESSTRYKTVGHGLAVSIGMLYAGYLSAYLHQCSAEDVIKIQKLLQLYSLPTRVHLNYPALYKALSYDKKFISGKIRMVLLKKIGMVKVTESVAPQTIKKTLKSFTRHIKKIFPERGRRYTA